MRSFKRFLLENRIDWLKKNVGEIDTSHDHLAVYHEPSEIIDHFARNADPTQNKRYTQWLVNQYKRKNIRQEDARRLHAILSAFEEHKHRLDRRDINQYSHPSEIEDAVAPHVERERMSDPFKHPDHERLLALKEADKVYSGESIDVYKLKTHRAACHYGRGTSWCTAEESPRHFNNYKRQGPLYVMHSKEDNRRHHLHFETNQFANERNVTKPLPELVRRYPEMREVEDFKKRPVFSLAVGTPADRRKLLDENPVGALRAVGRDHSGTLLLDREEYDYLFNKRNPKVHKAMLSNMTRKASSEYPLEPGHYRAMMSDAMKHKDSKLAAEVLWRTSHKGGVFSPPMMHEVMDHFWHDQPHMHGRLEYHLDFKPEHIDRYLDQSKDPDYFNLAQNPNLEHRHVEHIIDNGDSHAITLLMRKHLKDNPAWAKRHIGRIARSGKFSGDWLHISDFSSHLDHDHLDSILSQDYDKKNIYEAIARSDKFKDILRPRHYDAMIEGLKSIDDPRERKMIGNGLLVYHDDSLSREQKKRIFDAL